MCVFLLADEDDLHDVRSAVVDLAGRWWDLGDSLGIRSGDLDAIHLVVHSYICIIYSAEELISRF